MNKINSSLTSYVKIHDQVFQKSIRLLIPIPGFFKKIPFGELSRQLTKLYSETALNETILKDLVRYKRADEDDCHTVIEYLHRLLLAMQRLQEICSRMVSKIEGTQKLSHSEYNQLVISYREAEEAYFQMGDQLNYIFTKQRQATTRV